MTEHVVMVEEVESLKFGLTGIASIMQNIQVICSTYMGTVPFQRGMGIPVNVLDAPEPLARTILASSLIAAIEEFEPRAQIISVSFKDMDPMEPEKLTPIVKFIERGSE